MRKLVILLCMVLLLTACGNESKSNTDSTGTKTKSDVYANFQNIDIELVDNQAIVTGEVDVSDHIFFYQVEQKEQVYVEEQQVEVEEKWDEFKVVIDLSTEMENKEEAVIVKMYTKGKDGSIVNPNYIPIDVKTAEKE